MYKRNANCYPPPLPIAEYPINKKKPIKDFSNLCYQTNVNFINGYDADEMRNNAGGQYCKQQINNMLINIGINPNQYGFIHPPPVNINNTKLFANCLYETNHDADEALKMCVMMSDQNYTPTMCKNAYFLYNEVYAER